MDIRTFRTPGLGDTTYLFAHNGVGVVIDPQRDIDRFLDAAVREGLRVAYVLETHLHNDYVSGGRELAREAGAGLVLPAGSGAAYDHIPAFHLEDIEGVDGVRIRPIHTPGHTPEHVSYLILIDDQPVALFSGGSLLVGSAGRSDLLGTTRARQLSILQYGSLSRLAKLPDEVGLFPTHGEGSFCASTCAGRTTSTIGREKQENPVLAYPDAPSFADGQLAGLGPYPRYYAQMGPINTLGPTPIPRRSITELDPREVADRGQHVRVVDARPRSAYAAGHVPGAIGVELADDFGTWVGWVLPFNAPIILVLNVLNADQDADEAIVQLARIGFDDVRGVMRGMQGWVRSNLPTASFETVDARAFAEAVATGAASQVLDVRTPAEWESGHIPGSVHRFAPELAELAPAELPASDNVWVACASGFRASIAAGLLERHGHRPVVLLEGGIPEVLQHLPSAAPRREVGAPANAGRR